MSIGHATGTVADEEKPRQLIQQADNYLYQAKKQGKDQIIGKEQK